MKILKKIVILFLMFPFILLAQNNKIEQIDNKYKIKYWMNHYTYSINDNATIDNSFSRFGQKGCVIELNRNNSKPVLMKTKKKDFEFTFLHEISHCVLGKEVFYQPIDWKIDISKEEKEKIEKMIVENESFYLKNKKTPLIKVIYHEIFADTFASMLYLRNNENAEDDLKVLLRNRITQNENPYDSHLSVSAIEYILKNKEEIKNLTIEKLKDKAIKIAQEKLLEYIRAEYE